MKHNLFRIVVAVIGLSIAILFGSMYVAIWTYPNVKLLDSIVMTCVLTTCVGCLALLVVSDG